MWTFCLLRGLVVVGLGWGFHSVRKVPFLSGRRPSSRCWPDCWSLFLFVGRTREPCPSLSTTCPGRQTKGLACWPILQRCRGEGETAGTKTRRTKRNQHYLVATDQLSCLEICSCEAAPRATTWDPPSRLDDVECTAGSLRVSLTLSRAHTGRRRRRAANAIVPSARASLVLAVCGVGKTVRRSFISLDGAVDGYLSSRKEDWTTFMVVWSLPASGPEALRGRGLPPPRRPSVVLLDITSSTSPNLQQQCIANSVPTSHRDMELLMLRPMVSLRRCSLSHCFWPSERDFRTVAKTGNDILGLRQGLSSIAAHPLVPSLLHIHEWSLMSLLSMRHSSCVLAS